MDKWIDGWIARENCQTWMDGWKDRGRIVEQQIVWNCMKPLLIDR